MNLKLLALNMALAALLVFMGSHIHQLWRQDPPLPPPVADAAPGLTDLEASKKPIKKRSLVESSYRIIINRNIFSPTRKPPEREEAPKTPETLKELRVSGKKVALYGVLLAGARKSALISNPLYGQDDLALYKWVKEGDAFGDLQVIDIQRETIMVAEGKNQYRILLYDRNKAKSEAPKTERETPTVISTAAEKKPTVVDSKQPEDTPRPKTSAPFGIMFPQNKGKSE